MAFGSREYVFFAGQMALSIRYFNPDVLISIIADGHLRYLPDQYMGLFDKVIELEKEDYYTKNRIDPGKAKINLIKYLPYDQNIYFDVDGLCLRDISKLFEIDKFYATEVVGRGGVNDEINYAWWATNQKIWEYFSLSQDQKYSSIQSSFAIFNKGKELDEFHERLLQNFEFPMADLMNHWGGTVPDELVFAGSCAQINHDPDCGFPVVFFGHKLYPDTLGEIQDKYCILSMYGAGTASGKNQPLVRGRYRDWYDRLISDICRRTKYPQIGKIHSLLKTKHVNE